MIDCINKSRKKKERKKLALCSSPQAHPVDNNIPHGL